MANLLLTAYPFMCLLTKALHDTDISTLVK